MLMSMEQAITNLFNKQGWEIFSGTLNPERVEYVEVNSPDNFTEKIIVTVKQEEMSKAYLIDIASLSGYPEDMLEAWMDFYEFLNDRAEFSGAKVYAEKGLLHAFDSKMEQNPAQMFIYMIDEFNNIKLVENF